MTMEVTMGKRQSSGPVGPVRSLVTGRVWGAAATGKRSGQALDSSHRPMVITDGMKADGTLRVLTGDAARKAWLRPIRYGRG